MSTLARTSILLSALTLLACGPRAPRIATVGDMGRNGPIQTSYASMRDARPPLLTTQVSEVEPRDLTVCGVVTAAVRGQPVPDEQLRAELLAVSAQLGCEFVTHVAYVNAHGVRTAVGLSATATEPLNGMRLVMPQGGEVDREARMQLRGWPTHWGRRINQYLFRQARHNPQYVFVVDGFGGQDTSRQSFDGRNDRTSWDYTIQGHWVIDPNVPVAPEVP